jgi:hypothetical protein
MKVIRPGELFVQFGSEPTVFLAGSIEMGKAEKWQDAVEEALKDEEAILFNPRGKDDYEGATVDAVFDSFEEQVDWEQEGLEQADLIAMYFDVNALSPISLLELGQFAGHKNMIVCCPEGFWRKPNVDYIVNKYRIETADNLEEYIKMIKNYIKR